jgi:hypothetical protein
VKTQEAFLGQPGQQTLFFDLLSERSSAARHFDYSVSGGMGAEMYNEARP